MNQLMRYLFIAAYALLVWWLISGLLEVAGFGINGSVFWLAGAAWLLVCFTGFRWWVPLSLSTYRLRKTITEEDEWLHPLLHELTLRTQMLVMPTVYILESPEMEGYAAGHNSIILSRGLLTKLNEPEIRAVLAHEYGHLRDRDTLADTAFRIAGTPLRRLFWLLVLIWKPVQDKIRLFKRALWVAAVVVIFLFTVPDLGVLLLFLFIFRTGFPLLWLIVQIVWCWFSRRAEYRQDRFAQRLGCGMALKSALLKIDSLHSENLVSAIRQLESTHPMLYQRIRRIEWLEGLRPTP